LRYPCRIKEVVAAIRSAVPAEIPVSAKLRLGWDSIDSIYENATMAAEGGANWITIHARTRLQGYAPPVFWEPIGRVRSMLDIPVVANGDIWSLQDFRRCQEVTGCSHFMLGRCALSNPALPYQVAHELGLTDGCEIWDGNWPSTLQKLVDFTAYYEEWVPAYTVKRLKQWLKLASSFGDFPHFDLVKTAETVEELFNFLAKAEEYSVAV